MARENYWTNSDGLIVGFGTHSEDRNVTATPSTRGAVKEIIYTIYGVDVPDVNPTGLQIVNAAIIPTNSLLLSANLFVTTAFTSGGAAVLDIGTWDYTANAIEDDDGIDVALALTSLEDNDVVVCDGAQIGTVLLAPCVVYASYDTAAFTGGAANLVVRYIPNFAV